MGIGAYLLLIRLRRRWRSYVGVALLLGLLGGLALFAIAGARRTQSSYARFLRSAQSSTMAVTTSENFDLAANDAIAALPGVRRSRTYVGFNVSVLVDGEPDFSQGFEAKGTFDGLFFDQDRFTATKGRLPDPARPDEVAFNELAATRYGYQIGQRIEIGVYSIEQWLDPKFFTAPTTPVQRRTVTIVGLGEFPEEVIHDDGDRDEQLLLTPAFSDSVAQYATYGVQGLMLTNGDADVGRVRAEIVKLVPPGSVEFHTTSVDAAHARRALRPLSISLALFGVIAGIVGLVLGAQALARLHRSHNDENSLMRVFGATPRSIAATSLIPLGAVVAAGVIVAVLIAIAASPLMPIGPVRRVEVTSFDFDALVLLAGAAVTIVALLIISTLIVWRDEPERIEGKRRRPGHLSRLAAFSASIGLPPSAVIGLRSAFETPKKSDAVPNRSVLAGAVLAIVTVVGAVTFGASLTTLTDTPRMFGWDWDATVLSANGYGNIDVGDATAIFTADPHVATWSGAYFGDIDVDGDVVSALGIEAESAVRPPIIHGRMIESDDEIVLGDVTAAELRKHIGDEVTIADASGSGHQARVVGIAIFPSIGRLHTAHVSLGAGAIVVPPFVPHDRDITGVVTAGLGPNVIFVRYRDGTDTNAELDHLRTTTAPLSGFAGLDVLPAQRPAEIVNSRTVGGAPLTVALALALGATISLGLALAASVRKRTSDLAVLSALGFTRKQLASTVAWHATAMVVVGLLVGLPLGIVLGRELWLVFANQLHVVPQPTVPVGLLLVVPAALAIANLVAALPARAARSVRAANLTQLPLPQ